MNHSINQEKSSLLFIDEQGQKVSFENIRHTGVVPKDLIPHSKNALIMTLLHRLEKQNEFLIEQKKTQGYLGDLNDSDELDELDGLIAVMVNEVDFSKLSAVAKDKLINSLLRRVKKHHQLIENIKQRNVNEQERLKAVEVETPRDYYFSRSNSSTPKLDATDSDVTNSFVPLISGSISETDFAPQHIDVEIDLEPTAEPLISSRLNSVVDSEVPVEPVLAPPPLTSVHNEIPQTPVHNEILQSPDTEKYADYFAQLDEEQNKRTNQVNTSVQTPVNIAQNTADIAINKDNPQSKEGRVSVDMPETASALNPLVAAISKEEEFPSHISNDVVFDDDDDEDDESQYLFDLKEYYENDKAADNNIRNNLERTVIEVVMMRLGEIVNVEYVTAGQVYRTKIEGKKYKLIQNGKSDKYEFFYDSALFKGHLLKSDNAQPILLTEANKVEKRTLPNSGVIRLDAGNVTYLLKRVAPIVSPDVVVEKNTYKPLYQSLLGSAAFHFLVLLIGSLFVTLQLDITREPEPQFVSVDIKDLQPKVVAPKPPVPKVVKPKQKPTPKVEPKPKAKPKAKPKPVPKPKAAPKQVAKKASNKKPASTVKVNVKKSGLLASLGSPKSKKSSSKQALAKVTNLNAVSSLDSQSARVKVGGLSAKVANSRVSIPSGAALDAQGSMVSGEGRNNIAALNRGDVASGDIRGKVTASLTKKAKIGGGLSREAVKKVIDENMAEVTYCYEKALVGNSNLSGKAVFEWKILQNGSVGQVGIQSSTLHSNKLHSCIKGAIKGWQFPQPKGVSTTTVSYPFIFNMVGF